MTDDNPLRSIPGKFTSDVTIELWCEHCKANTKFRHQVWESADGAYIDELFTCSVCRGLHWEDGME